MTPAEILSQVRSQFDDPSSVFITDDEAYGYIWQGLYILCAKFNVKEDVDTSITTISGTADYTLPENFIKTQQLLWDNRLITRRDVEKFYLVTGSNPSSGRPQYYQIFGKTLTLAPIPTEAKTVKILGYGRPTKITAANAGNDIYDTDGIEERYQQAVIDYVLMRVDYKDDDRKALEYKDLWNQSLNEIQLEQDQKTDMDNHNTVLTVDDDIVVWSDL